MAGTDNYGNDDAMQKKWKAFCRKIDTKTDDFDTVLRTIKEFLTEPYMAAIEGRLEVILGILGAPCNKNADPVERRKVNISHRINCLEKIYNSDLQIGNTKLDYSRRL